MEILVTLHIDTSQKQKLIAAAGNAELLFLPSREVADDILSSVDAGYRRFVE